MPTTSEQLQQETLTLVNMRIAHDKLRPDDITGRQNSIHKLVAQELAVKALSATFEKSPS